MSGNADLNWQGELASPPLEQEFQASKWAFNANRMKFVCGFSALIYLAAAYPDHLELGLTRSFYTLLAFRAFTAAVGMASALLAFKKQPFAHHAWTVALYMALVLVSESVDTVIKYEALGNQMIPYTVIIILTFYLFLPVRTLPTLAASLSGSVLYAWTLALFTGITPANLTTIILFLILVNAFGLYFLTTFARSQRKEFLALKEERRLNQQLKREVELREGVEKEQKELIGNLQKAIEEVKQLQGLIPICANCKKIRDDKGYWEQIETYIQERSSATFTHGICPECVRKLYPQFAKE